MTRRGKPGKLQKQRRVSHASLGAWKSGQSKNAGFPHSHSDDGGAGNILTWQDDSPKVTFLNGLTGLTLRTAARLLRSDDGRVTGKANLRAYFQRGLQAYPNLCFQLEDVLWGVSSVVFYYRNQDGARTAEFMELSSGGKVVRVVANQNA